MYDEGGAEILLVDMEILYKDKNITDEYLLDSVISVSYAIPHSLL
jgi:hypothetical protein